MPKHFAEIHSIKTTYTYQHGVDLFLVTCVMMQLYNVILFCFVFVSILWVHTKSAPPPAPPPHTHTHIHTHQYVRALICASTDVSYGVPRADSYRPNSHGPVSTLTLILGTQRRGCTTVRGHTLVFLAGTHRCGTSIPGHISV